MESIFAASITPAGRKVKAKLAGSISAVCCELRADGVIHISTGISDNTGTWSQKGVTHTIIHSLNK